MAEFFRDVDALLMPVAVVPAIPHDHSEPFPERVIRVDGGDAAIHRLVRLDRAGDADVPAGHRRSGRPHGVGLPVGIQIVGPYLEDRTTLAVARLVEELLGGFVPPPGV